MWTIHRRATWVNGRDIRKNLPNYRIIRLFPSLGWFEDDLCDDCEYFVVKVDYSDRAVFVTKRRYCHNH